MTIGVNGYQRFAVWEKPAAAQLGPQCDGGYFALGRQVPELENAVVRAGSSPATIQRDGPSLDADAMALELSGWPGPRHFPQTQGAIVRPGQERLPIGSEAAAGHNIGVAGQGPPLTFAAHIPQDQVAIP